MPKRKPFRLQRYDLTKRFSTVSGSTYYDTSDPSEHLILWARAANKDPVPLVAEDASTQDHDVTFIATSRLQESRTSPFDEDSFSNITSPVRFQKDSGGPYVSVEDADDLSFGDGSTDSSFTLASWFLITSASATTSLFHKGTETMFGDAREYAFVYHDGGLTGSLIDASAEAALLYSASIVSEATEGTWHHFAFTYNSAASELSRGQIYFDGLSISTNPEVSGSYTAMEPSIGTLDILDNRDNQPVEFFDAAIWSGKVLSAEEVNALYNAKDGLVDVAKDRVYIKTSGITSLPPRPYLHNTDNATGSYPPTYRLGDARSGYYTGSFTSDKRYVISASPFNDTDTILFQSFGQTAGVTGSVILGQQLPTYSKFTGSLVANTNTVPDLNVTSSQTAVVAGISDARVSFTPGVDYKPYIEDFNESLGRMSTNDPFWATGSAVSEVGPGFSMPVWSKTKLEIDINPAETTKIYWSTGSANAQMSSGLYYYNFDLKRFESHGDYSTGSNVDYISQVPIHQTGSYLAFNPAIVYTDLPIRAFEGNPVNTAGFPFDMKFNATSSQHFDTAQIIQHPFLVEKMVYEFSGSLPFLQTTTNAPNITQFFIMNEMNYPVAGDLPGSTTRIITGSYRASRSYRSIPGYGGFTPVTSQSFIVDTPRDLVTYAMMSCFDSNTVSNDLNKPAEENGFARDLNILVTSANAAPTGTFAMSASLRSPVAGDGVGLLQARELSFANGVAILKNQFGGRTGTGRAVNGLMTPRSFTDTASSITPSSSFTPSGPEYLTVQVSKKINEVSPYLLLPGDRLVLGWCNQQQPVVNSTERTEAALAGQGGYIGARLEDGRLTIAPGRGKVTLYGSILKDGKEFHNGLNQNLTSDAVHEDVKSSDRFSNADCIDQFDADYRFSLTGSCVDLAFSQVESRDFGLASSRIGFRPNSVLGGKAGTTGSILRGLALIDTNERYQDSFFPDPREIARVNQISFVADSPSSPKFGAKSYVMYPLGPEVDAVLDAPADLRWPRAFPFESDYGALEFENRVGKAPRILDVTFFDGSDLTDADTFFGDPVSTITGRNTSTQATNEIFALMNIDGAGAGSPPAGARKLFLKSFFGIGDAVNGNPRIVKNVSDDAEANYNGGNDVELRGFKYGLYNVVPAFTRAVYRRDRYGQFRDMLEQRVLTAFEPYRFVIPKTGIEAQTLEQPVTIQFKKTNATGVGDKLRIELLDGGDFTRMATNNGSSGDQRAVWNQGCNIDRFARVIKPYYDSNPVFQIFDPDQINDDDEDSALIMTLAE